VFFFSTAVFFSFSLVFYSNTNDNFLSFVEDNLFSRVIGIKQGYGVYLRVNVSGTPQLHTDILVMSHKQPTVYYSHIH